MTTPAPTPLHPLSFAERFWAQVRGPEIDDIPEPLRSVVLVRHFLSSLDRLDAASPRKAAAALVALLRQAELEGDLSYASPEQVRGEILDTRSVVFSLGVVLFERLTGRHPFGAENNRPRRIDRIRKGELGSGVNSFPTVAAGLRSVLVRAMSPFPEERWPDLRQMRELLASYISQESPSPRLPGTEADAPPSEQTKVVRMATDFGRELMQVVAQHDRPPTARPVTEPPRGVGPRTSQRLAVPTSGVATVTGGTAPARRPRQATPRGGVVALRSTPAVAPPSPTEPSNDGDSVITRIHTGGTIDPLGETMVQAMPSDADVARRIDDALREVNEPSIAIAAPAVPPPARRLPPPRPTPAAAARQHAAASVPPISAAVAAPPPVAAPPRITPPSGLPAVAEYIPLYDVMPPPKNRTALVAVVSAVVGAAVAVSLFIALRSAPASSAAASASPAVAEVAAPEAVAEPEAAPVAPAPVAPAAEVVAPTLTSEEKIAEKIATCMPARSHGSQVFGLSLLFRFGAIAKPYFAAGDALTSAQHGCIGRSLRGMALVDAPHSAVNEYRVRIDASGVHVSTKASHAD